MENDAIGVLLIDDDEKFAEVTRHHLSKFPETKFNLVWKRDGDSGIQELQSNPSIDIIVMDYFLPGNNGIEIIKKLKECNRSVPVVFLTMHKNFEAAVEAMRHGVRGYLIKDEISDAILPQTIRSILNQVKSSEKLVEAQKQRSLARKRFEAIQALIVTISHEINNPLAAIKISADIISRQGISQDERAFLEEFLEKIKVLEKELIKLRDFWSKMDVNDGNVSV